MTTNNTTNTPFPLTQANGGTGLTAEKSIIQIVSSVISRATYSTSIPFDNTKPQSSEGSEVGTCTITPKAASNIIEVYIELHFVSGTAAAQAATMALFRDSGTDAIMTAFGIISATTQGRIFLQMTYRVAAGSTSATTFKLRAGGNNAVTWYTNAKTDGTQLWADADETSIYITEIEA